MSVLTSTSFLHFDTRSFNEERPTDWIGANLNPQIKQVAKPGELTRESVLVLMAPICLQCMTRRCMWFLTCFQWVGFILGGILHDRSIRLQHQWFPYRKAIILPRPTQLHRRTKSSRRFAKPALASQMRLLQGMSTKDWFQHVSKQAHDFAWHFLRSFSLVILSSIRISRVTTSSLKSICERAQRFQTHQGIGDSTVETRSLSETNYNVNDKLKPDVWLEPCQVSRKKDTLEKHGKKKHL